MVSGSADEIERGVVIPKAKIVAGWWLLLTLGMPTSLVIVAKNGLHKDPQLKMLIILYPYKSWLTETENGSMEAKYLSFWS